MKVLWPTLALAGFAAALIAQNSSPAPERAPTVVTSDSVDFDLKTRLAVYRGNVVVEDATMKLNCAVLAAKVPESGGKIESIVAEQNVTIDATDEKGRITHGTCDKLIYTYHVTGSVTNETVELIGNPRLKNTMGNLTGEILVWDKANGHVYAKNQRMTFVPGGTNSIPTLLTQPAGDKK